MNTFFCADYSRHSGEDIIGSATNHQTYVLVECPMPWVSDAFESKQIPAELQRLVAQVKQDKLSVRFLLIANRDTHRISRTKVVIYDKKAGLSTGYSQYEINLKNIDEVAGAVKAWLAGNKTGFSLREPGLRDILVCTHGSHDKCCAKYGNPFYIQALAAVADLNLSRIRIWKTSHFGGHRFAPTMIDLPQGRYYGVVDPDSFRSILTRSGDIRCLNKIYRGWGILPTAIQVLERELILRYGWDWFSYQVAGRIVAQNFDKSLIHAEIAFVKPDGAVYTYEADLVKDENRTLRLKGSCDASQESEFVKYAVTNLRVCSQDKLACNA